MYGVGKVGGARARARARALACDGSTRKDVTPADPWKRGNAKKEVTGVAENTNCQ